MAGVRRINRRLSVTREKDPKFDNWPTRVGVSVQIELVTATCSPGARASGGRQGEERHAVCTGLAWAVLYFLS